MSATIRVFLADLEIGIGNTWSRVPHEWLKKNLLISQTGKLLFYQ